MKTKLMKIEKMKVPFLVAGMLFALVIFVSISGCLSSEAQAPTTTISYNVVVPTVQTVQTIPTLPPPPIAPSIKIDSVGQSSWSKYTNYDDHFSIYKPSDWTTTELTVSELSGLISQNDANKIDKSITMNKIVYIYSQSLTGFIMIYGVDFSGSLYSIFNDPEKTQISNEFYDGVVEGLKSGGTSYSKDGKDQWGIVSVEKDSNYYVINENPARHMVLHWQFNGQPLSGDAYIIAHGNAYYLELFSVMGGASQSDTSTATTIMRTFTTTETSTQTPTIARVQDPIIGVWRYTTSDNYDSRIQFNNDGTFVTSFYLINEQRTISFSGSWRPQDSNSYSLTYSSVNQYETWIHDPARNAIYNTKYPSLVHTPYKGDVATEVTVSKDEIHTDKTTINTQSKYPQFTRVDQIHGKWEEITGTDTIVITIKNDGQQTVYLDVTTTKPGYIGNFLQGNIVATGSDRFQMSFKPDYTTPAELGGTLIKISTLTWKYDEVTGNLVSDANERLTYIGPDF